VVDGLLATIPASLHMKRAGRQRGFIHGTLIGIAGARPLNANVRLIGGRCFQCANPQRPALAA